jgi:hypothetical protein
MPTIVIDLSFFQRLIEVPLTELWFGFFKYGGWIPLAWIFWYGLSRLWLMSREAKFAASIQYVLLNISIPRANEQSPKAVEHIFAHLAGVYSAPNFKEKWWIGKFTPPFSFEFCSIDGHTRFLVRAPVPFRDLIEAAVFSQYAEAEISEIPDYTREVPQKFPDPEWDCWGSEFVLSKPSAYPIRSWLEFEHSLSQELKDPMTSLLEAMARLKKGEQVWLQILVYPRDQKWVEDSAKIVGKMTGLEVKKPTPMWATAIHAGTDIIEGTLKEVFSAHSEEKPKPPDKKNDPLRMLAMSPGGRKVIEGIEMKMSKLGFGVKFRFVYVAKRNVFRKGPLIAMIRGAIGLLGSLDANSFRFYPPVTPKTDYFWQRWAAPGKIQNIFKNFQNRSSNGAPRFVLNTEELASLYHFPSVLTKAPMIKKVESKKVEPPFTLPGAD